MCSFSVPLQFVCTFFVQKSPKTGHAIPDAASQVNKINHLHQLAGSALADVAHYAVGCDWRLGFEHFKIQKSHSEKIETKHSWKQITPVYCILTDRRVTLQAAFHPAIIKLLPALHETRHIAPWFPGKPLPTISAACVSAPSSSQNAVALQVSSSLNLSPFLLCILEVFPSTQLPPKKK